MVNSGGRKCITIEILDDSDVESQEQPGEGLTIQSFSVQYGYCNTYSTDNDGKYIMPMYGLIPGHSSLHVHGL